VVEWGERGVELEHVSVSGSTPTPIESLFVAGLYIAMLEQIGCTGLSCAFPASSSAGWVFADGAAGTVPATGTGRWRFEWAGVTPRQPLPGLDDLVLENPGRDLEEGSFATRVAFLVERDLSRKWTVRDIAGDLMLSPRTLQRRLREEHTSLTAVIADSRITRARRLLVETSNSVTDIGYMLGFSDTPHFSRAFSAAEGMPPSQWRDRGTPKG
jgi:AraC-like DNA-binding protein